MEDEADVVELTRRLVAFDTVNPPANEADAIAFCASFLTSFGFACQVVDHGDRRASLIAVRGHVGKQALCFSGHLDTVPLGRSPWSVPAHEGRIVEDRLYGRGSSDMKGGIAAFLVAAARSAPQANGGLSVILTAGEETGCDGARWLAEVGALPEAGAIIVGESTGNQALAGHKGVLWLKLSAHGKTTHGATPELGINAIARMAPSLGRLAQFKPDVSHPEMGQATCNLGTLSAGINVNSVPDLCELCVDLRSVAGVTHAELAARVRALCDPEIEMETLLDLAAVWTDPAQPWFARAAARTREVTGQMAGMACANYFTDASILQPAMGAPPVMILGPGSVDQPHSTDEYVRIPRLIEAVEVYSALIRDWDGEA